MEPQKEQTRLDNLVAKAKALAEAGSRVHIITDTTSKKRAISSALKGAGDVKVSILGSVGNFDWEKLRISGDLAYTYLIDPSVIESKYGHIIEALHRFDAPEVSTESSEQEENTEQTAESEQPAEDADATEPEAGSGTEA